MLTGVEAAAIVLAAAPLIALLAAAQHTSTG